MFMFTDQQKRDELQKGAGWTADGEGWISPQQARFPDLETAWLALSASIGRTWHLQGN